MTRFKFAIHLCAAATALVLAGQAAAADHIELAAFRAKPGVSDATLLAAIDSMKSTVRQFPGFLRRDTVKMDDGSWLDIVHWRDRQAALAAFELAGKSTQCQQFFALIDEKEPGVTRGQALRVQAR